MTQLIQSGPTTLFKIIKSVMGHAAIGPSCSILKSVMGSSDGAYLVDGTGHAPHNSVAVCMDAEVNSEMRAAYGYTMAYPHGLGPTAAAGGAALYHDLLHIFQALSAVINNGPNSVAGGGKPRVPRAPCQQCHPSEAPVKIEAVQQTVAAMIRCRRSRRSARRTTRRCTGPC